MNIAIEPGRYVVAVSGGVDSMVLLNLLSRKHGAKLTVAHFDHGIRNESSKDRLLVQKTAHQLKLPFVYSEGHLGPNVSEAKARDERYKFLRKASNNVGADALITAHHQDDVIETALINILRGTGRRGLTSLKSQDGILRPLLNWPKHIIISYAKNNDINWNEDSTNRDTKYLRNYVRSNLASRLSAQQKRALLNELEKLSKLNNAIDVELINHLHLQPSVNEIDRQWFIMLPHDVSVELMAQWLRKHGIAYNKTTLNKLVTAAKSLKPGKSVKIDNTHKLTVTHEILALVGPER